MRVDVSVGTDITKPTPRMRQVSAMFDAPIAEKLGRTWTADLPLDAQPWQVGAIIGPSGSGKSTVARHLFGEPTTPTWRRGVSVVDDFPPELGVSEISELLGSVGFNTIPSWMRPYETLSNGERFRCDLARALALTNLVSGAVTWVDEFTSVVDRQVAQIGSQAVARYVRKEPHRSLVVASCHYDIESWLQPDWIFEPATCTFRWRSVQPRPRIEGVIRRAHRDVWNVFAPYHYLTAKLHQGARCFTLDINDRPVAFAAILPLPVSNGPAKGTAIYRLSRIVVLPDWQGIGLVHRLGDTLASAYAAHGRRFRVYPAHPALVAAYGRKPETWRQTQEAGILRSSSARSETSATGVMGARPCAVFEYAGPAMDLRAASRLLALGI